MRHGMANKKLNRTSEHRKALLKNMLNSLIKYEQIKTTLPKAKFLKPQADKIITLGKKETLQTTKMLVSQLQDVKSANKVKKTLSISPCGILPILSLVQRSIRISLHVESTVYDFFML